MNIKSKIKIGQVSRWNMQFSFIWPNFTEELNPGRWYYIKISSFLFGFSILILSTFIHLSVTLNYKLDLYIIEDIAVITSMGGIWYMATLYVRNQPKIAKLLLDLSVFNFGKPPNFDRLNKKLNFWSWLAFMYPTCGLTTYNLMKLLQKGECEKMNKILGLDEKCGLVHPYWIPFEINYFPVFHIILIYTWISATLFVRLHLSIFFQALEISHHIILRIKHLSSMIEESFEETDYKVCCQKFVRCIKYHQEILDMAQRLDSCFSDLMFIHFVMTAAICGCLEKQFVDGVYSVNAVVHLAGWILSLFIASFGGQKILESSDFISEALWKSKWYSTDVRLQKDMLFFLLQSQKGLYITVGSFGILSYNFFLTVLKMSYSVLAMLTS